MEAYNTYNEDGLDAVIWFSTEIVSSKNIKFLEIDITGGTKLGKRTTGLPLERVLLRF